MVAKACDLDNLDQGENEAFLVIQNKLDYLGARLAKAEIASQHWYKRARKLEQGLEALEKDTRERRTHVLREQVTPDVISGRPVLDLMKCDCDDSEAGKQARALLERQEPPEVK
jgi:hypothetical protein